MTLANNPNRAKTHDDSRLTTLKNYLSRGFEDVIGVTEITFFLMTNKSGRVRGLIHPCTSFAFWGGRPQRMPEKTANGRELLRYK